MMMLLVTILLLGNAFSATYAAHISQLEISAQPHSNRQGRRAPAEEQAASNNNLLPTQPPIGSNVQINPNHPNDNKMDVPWCADYKNCGQRQRCNDPVCPAGFTCCRSLEGICCREINTTTRHERAPYQLQTNMPFNRPSYPPSTLQLPQTIPIRENKLTIPIPLPTVSYNGSLDYNKTHYYPFVLDLTSLNLPPNFRPVNFVLKSVTLSPTSETEYTENYEPPSPTEELPIRMTYSRPSLPPESMYSYPEPSRYYKVRGSPFAAPMEPTSKYPYFSASLPMPTYIPRPQTLPDVYQPFASNYKEPEPAYRYEQPSAGEQINPVTGERIPSRVPSYQRSYRSYDTVYYRVPQYRRFKTPHDPQY